MDINKQDADTGVTAMMCACASGGHDMVKLLLKKGGDPTISDNNGFNSLHCAIWGKV